jgi:RimJ/RimL family protein N-acetyltransferase
MLPLQTNRLMLRPFLESDLPAFAAYRSIPEVARYQSWTTPYTLEQARLFLEEINRQPVGTPGAWYQLVIERREQPGIIGDCALHVLANDPHQAHIGVTLSPLFQKQGYAAEAVTALLGYLFGELGLHRISAVCDVKNQASFQLLERVGMRREAHFIKNIWFKDTWGSEYIYAILSEEWFSRK